ncbi:MAG: hypothetical protein IKZ58_06500 [Selenomonadaceae bacterium]|nr:hypothetical protein [Selenomonadaceae bacterium]
MDTVVSASNVSITGTADADLIRSTGDGVTISAMAGDDYALARGQGSYIYGGNGNDTVILLPAIVSSSTGSGGAAGGGKKPNATLSTDTEIYGDAGNDDIMIVHDSAIVYGGAGDDYITVKLYESAGEFLTSLSNITLTGGDGRDTFSFNTSLPTNLDTLSSVSGYKIQAVITDFSNSAHFCYDSSSDYFVYSILTDSQGNYTDIVLTDDAERLSVTLQGVTDIEDIVYATAVKFTEDSLKSSYLGAVLSNYGEDMSSVPEGINYYDYTVYVYNQYNRNVWLLGTDEVNKTSTYRNISAKTLDARNSTIKRTLVGNTRSNIIYAGSGGDSLWGGNSANDTLYGGSGRDMFWYGTGDGTDCIKNFVCGSEKNSDVINFYNGGIANIYRNNNALHVGMITGEELVVTLDYDVDTEIQYSADANSISRVKVGNLYESDSFTYDAGINFFIGCSKDNTLKVEGSRTNMIWLDGSYGQVFQDITNIDASEATGNNQLAGSNYAADNIIGGSGSSSLWGGSGNQNDTLTGGTGAEMFFYGNGDGSDIIIGATASDTINLYNISIGDITGFETVKGGMTLSFTNGNSSLTLQNYSDSPTFLLSDGSKWAYEKNVWTRK